MSRSKTDRPAARQAARRIWQRARQTAQDAKPVAAQVKPLADDTRQAASRGLRKARAWVAPQVDRTGQVLQDTVAPKVAAALTATARRLEPGRPRRSRWRKLVGLSALAAAASAIAAALRKRQAPDTASPAEPASDGADQAAPASGPAQADGKAMKSAATS